MRGGEGAAARGLLFWTLLYVEGRGPLANEADRGLVVGLRRCLSEKRRLER